MNTTNSKMATIIQRAWRHFVNENELYAQIYKCEKCNSIDYAWDECCCGKLRLLHTLMRKNAEYRWAHAPPPGYGMPWFSAFDALAAGYDQE
jgi:hypothetical protein